MDQSDDKKQESAGDNGQKIREPEAQEADVAEMPTRKVQIQRRLLKNLLITTPSAYSAPESAKYQTGATSVITNTSELFSTDSLGLGLSDEIGIGCSEGKLLISIIDLANLKETIYSPPIYIRNLPWRIMVVPREKNKQCDKAIAVYLQCNYDAESSSWSCKATAILKLINYKNDIDTFTRNINHLFYCKENDWGYSNFMEYDRLLDPNVGYLRNNIIEIEAYVKAEVPLGIYWDSKKYTGYIGLKNQGATCYMNSLLQTLYFTSSLRKSVYKIPTEASDSSTSVALALQKVFYDLQFSNESVGTKKLTKSFGWETNDSFLQHDIQEFLRVLLDKLETEMKGTSIEYSIPSLFEGKMLSYIKCINIDYESKRLETFYDIQLNIKGKKNIAESFADYVKAETLEDLYDAGRFGFQRAQKGVKFKSFPPVLYLHLMRFQYDPVTSNPVKFNDRFEFYNDIDLDPYLYEKEFAPAAYKLYAVLVHSGDNQGGHYVVYITPKVNGQWFKFDDQVVSNCSESEAMENNYGSDDNNGGNSSAYMLVYIKACAISRILEDVKSEDIPSELINKLIEEKRLQTLRKQERAESSSYINVHVILEEFFEFHQFSDLYEPREVTPKIFRMKKSETIGELFNTLVKAFKVDPSRMRMWKIGTLVNLIRPVYLDTGFESPLETILTKNQLGWEIYLEKRLPHEIGPLLEFVKHEHILIFFRYYDPVKQRLNYMCSAQYSIHKKISDILPEVWNSELPPVQDLMVYEEVKLNVLQQIPNLEDSIQNALLVNGQGNICGTVLILQHKSPDFNLDFPTCQDYFTYILYQVEVVFENKLTPFTSLFQLKLSKTCSYTELIHHLARKLDIDYTKIQLFKCQREEPHVAIKSNYTGTLKDILGGHNPRYYKIFYQILTMPLIELENKKQFKCLWIPSSLKEEKEIILYLNINENVKFLLDTALEIVDLPENSTRKLRLILINEHKIVKLVNEETLISSLLNITDNKISQYTPRYYRVEEYQKDELEITDNDFLIPVIHFNRDTNSSFGNPFLIKISHNENFGSIKIRIKSRLTVLDKDWDRYKFIIESMVKTETVIDDNYIIDLDEFRMKPHHSGIEPLPYIGLDHINVNKSVKRTRYGYGSIEKSIKIYN